MKNIIDTKRNIKYVQEEYVSEMQRIYKEEDLESIIDKLIRMIITNK
jgi:hypothetical protein